MTTPQKKLHVLACGLDAESAGPYLKMQPAELDKLLHASLAEMNADPSVEVEVCWLSLAETNPAARLEKAIMSNEGPLDGVMLGWGVRGTPALSWLLEDCVEIWRRAAPTSTKILFSTTPSDHLETIYRKFPHAKASTTQS